MGIIITSIICVTVFLISNRITITVKHVHTTEIADSFKEYQEFLLDNNSPTKGEDDEEEESDIQSLDDVVNVVRNMWEGGLDD